MPVFLFFLGLAMGSFLNVVILRFNTGETLRGRSRCFSCLKKLEWYDLVPLASYFAIRGRCRYCGSGISAQYPIVELASGFLFVSLGWLYFSEASFVAFDITMARFLLVSIFFLLLLAISVYDLRHKIIPDEFSLALLVVALLRTGLVWYIERSNVESSLPVDIVTGVALFLFFAGLWYFSRGRWMGFGDAKIAFSIGLFLGFPAALVGLLFAFWSGAAVGIALLVLGKASRKTEVPFAPFLAFGSLAAFFFIYGDTAMMVYRYLFGI